MSDEYRFPMSLRSVIRDALPEDTSLRGRRPELRHTYLPAGHAKALHPDNMLVTGIRGAGKSFWWAALQDEKVRSAFSGKFPRASLTVEATVSAGFGERSNPVDYPGKDTIADLLTRYDSRQIWRTIVLWHVTYGQIGESPLARMNEWTERVAWVQEQPEQVECLFDDADRELDRAGKYHLILFDALDRTADEWPEMHNLVKGLLQVLLECSSTRRIRPKAFLRADQIEDPQVTAFPDASKVLARRVDLVWPPNELYGLFWQYLANATEGGQDFRKGCEQGCGITWSKTGTVWDVPDSLKNDEALQRKVFHAITGPYMGKDRRRGYPYTWLPNRLGDTRRQVSPRSFLAALRKAAEDEQRKEYGYALHYENIKTGVQEASKIRVDELREDYLWVDKLMAPLEGLSLPCSFEEIVGRWELQLGLTKFSEWVTASSVRLPPANIALGAVGIRKDLESLGLFERMSDGRVNLPDVYRIGYRLGRKGGVKPLARG